MDWQMRCAFPFLTQDGTTRIWLRRCLAGIFIEARPSLGLIFAKSRIVGDPASAATGRVNQRVAHLVGRKIRIHSFSGHIRRESRLAMFRVGAREPVSIEGDGGCHEQV